MRASLFFSATAVSAYTDRKKSVSNPELICEGSERLTLGILDIGLPPPFVHDYDLADQDECCGEERAGDVLVAGEKSRGV